MLKKLPKADEILSVFAARSHSWLRKHGELAFAMVLALGFTLIYLHSADVVGLPYDDSYISLNFARNLADYGFLTFNGETASAGATSLLHVAILAMLIKLGGEPVVTSLAVGIACQMALVAAVYFLAWSIFRDRWTSFLAAVSIGIMGYLALDALNGMETTLFLLMTTAAAAVFFTATSWRGYLVAGFLVALSVLTRPEGILFLAAVALYYVITLDGPVLRLSSEDLRGLAMVVLPSILVLVGLTFYYWNTTGTITPGTATAKLFFFREFEWSYLDRYDVAQGGVMNFVAPVLPWLVLGGFVICRREVVLFAFSWMAFVIMYFVLFPGGLWHYWYRYQHVFLPPLAVFGAAGLVCLVRGRTWRTFEIVAGIAIGVVLVGMMVFQYENFCNRYVYEISLIEDAQVGIAKFLRDKVPSNVAIATHDIGAIGYYSQRDLIDLVGLVNPDVVDFHDGRRLREYVDNVQPGYIVVLNSWENLFLRIGFADSPELFEPVRVFAGDFPGGESDRFTVYRTHYMP